MRQRDRRMADRTNRKKRENRDQEMPLSEHLRELRGRLLVCAAFLVAALLAGLHFAPGLVELLLEIGRSYHYRFVYIAPQEMLMQYVSTALLLGVCVTLPVFLYESWAFARPGLRKNENLIFLFTMVFGLLCFGLGVYFAYRIMLPFMLYFLSSIGGESGVSAAVSVQNYMAFLMTVFVVFGIVFELPVISILLTQMGLLRVQWMRRGRRVVIVAIFVAAALITPPDVVSQIMVAIPMMALYELSILLCTAAQKLRDRAEKRKKNSYM